jgi:diguanylate cyclase (GGDEF)-like protein/PAS domain S-box-containing protein
LIETIPAMTYVRLADDAGTLAYVSPQVRWLIGLAPDEVPRDRRRWAALLHPDDLDRVLADQARGEAEGTPFRAEYRLRTTIGDYVWVRDEATPVQDANGLVSAWHGVVVDISEQKRRELELVHRALHDHLTGLPNRALFVDRLGHALARARREGGAVGVLVLGIDGFGAVNERFGRSGGDRLLVGVGERLRASLRPGDTVARLGGDEYGMVLAGMRLEIGAERAAERVAMALWPAFGLPGGETQIAASIGAAVGRPLVDGPDALLARADAAMHRTKRLAKDRFGFFGGAVATDLLGDVLSEADSASG